MIQTDSITLPHGTTLHCRTSGLAGRPVLLGLSRKRMLGAVLGDAEQGRAPLSTAVMTVWGHLHGAQIHRVHDVAECARALRLIRAAEPFVR